jgi:hypothetical protein
MKTADTIPTCLECGSRIFGIDAYGIATADISFEEDEEDGEWGQCDERGDHGNENCGAICSECDTDMEPVLVKHGWTFYETVAKPELAELRVKAAKLDAIMSVLVDEQGWIELRSCADAIQDISMILDPEHKIQG